jgi:hypothetical protein
MNRGPEFTIAETVARHTPRLMALPGVVGTGEGLTDDTRPCVVVYVKSHSPDTSREIAPELDGHPVVVRAVGTIRPL